jgi:hypothetical protein
MSCRKLYSTTIVAASVAAAAVGTAAVAVYACIQRLS